MTDWNATRVWAEGDQLTETRANDYLRENLDHLKEDADPPLLNKDSVTLAVGDVVVLDTAASGVKRTTTDAHGGPVYVVDIGAAVDATVYVHKAGCYCKVKVNGTVVYGDLLKTTTTAGRAGVTATGTEAFARALEANASGDGLIHCEVLPHPTYSTATIDFGESGDIQPTGQTAAAGATGEAADAGHVHVIGAHNHNGSTGHGGELTSPRLITDIKSTGGTNTLLQVINSKGLAIGSAANATTDTDPYFYITTSPGAPTGVPTTATGRVALHFDTTNNRLYIYDGAWLYVQTGTAGLTHLDLGALKQAGVTRTAVQSIPDSTETEVIWNSEGFDTDTMHDNVTANTKITTTTAGTYLFIAALVWAANATGRRQLRFLYNSSSYRGLFAQQAMPSGEGFTSGLTVVPMAANDTMGVAVSQFSGGALDLAQAGDYPYFWAFRLGA